MLLLAKNSTLPKLIRNGRLFLGGALLGVLVFVLVFGVSTLDVTNDAFCRGGYIEKDISSIMPGGCFTAKAPLAGRFALPAASTTRMG